MNKKIFIFGILATMLATFLPTHAMAQDAQTRYNIGWSAGQNQAQQDWISQQFTMASGGDPTCDEKHHSHAYCNGYVGGYNDEWTRSVQINTGSPVAQDQGQDQGAQCNINGNNNRCEIQQGQQATAGGSDGSGDRSGSSLPRCVILCATVR